MEERAQDLDGGAVWAIVYPLPHLFEKIPGWFVLSSLYAGCLRKEPF
jgi:hypothetical protein